MGIDEVGIDKVGIDKVGIDKVGINEVGITHKFYQALPFRFHFSFACGESLGTRLGHSNTTARNITTNLSAQMNTNQTVW